MKKICSALLVVIAVYAPALAQRKAVFIIVDGIPADVIEKLDMPMLKEITTAGGYTNAYQGGGKGTYSESPTISAVGYNHVLTGTWTHKHNVWDNDIDAPNYHYWNIFRILKAVNPERKTAIFSSWQDNRTKLVGEGLLRAGNMKFDYAYDGLELDTLRIPHTRDRKFMLAIDEQVSTEAARYIQENGPDLSWVYLEFTDDMGHMYGDSPEFYDAVKKADAQIGRVWKAIQARKKQYNEDWMLVITTDHGRDTQTGKHHGGQSDRERTTWIATNVKNLNPHFKETPGAIDIAPSILSFMNITIPEPIQRELDGISFVNDISISNLQATRHDNTVNLTWTTHNPKGNAQILITPTNTFATGGTDTYTTVGKVPVKKSSYSFPLPTNTDLYKIVVKAPNNTATVWIVKDGYKTVRKK